MIPWFCKQGGDAVCGELFNAVMFFSCAGYAYCRVVAMYWSGQDTSARTARAHQFGHRNEDNFQLRSYGNAADLHRKWNPLKWSEKENSPGHRPSGVSDPISDLTYLIYILCTCFRSMIWGDRKSVV